MKPKRKGELGDKGGLGAESPTQRDFFPLWVAVYLGFWLSVLFKHTRGLLYASGILAVILCLFYKNFLANCPKEFKKISYVLVLFLISLLPGVILSPFPWTSLDGYFLSYFFHVILFFLLVARFSPSDPSLWMIPSVLMVFSFFYCLFIFYKTCAYNLSCWLYAGMGWLPNSWIKGVVSISPALVFAFLFLGAYSLTSYRKIRLFLAVSSGISFFFLLWFARRAALFGLFLGLVLVGLFSPSKKIFQITLGTVFWMIILVIALYLYPPTRKALLWKYDQIHLIFSGSRQALAQDGSLGQRLYIWPLYLKEASRRIFRGTGLTRRVQKRVLADLNRRALRLEHAHNLFLNMWLQAGLLPVLIFIFFYALTLKQAFLWLKNTGDPLAAAMFAFLVSFLVMSSFEGLEEMTRFTLFWVASGIVWGYAVRKSSHLSG